MSAARPAARLPLWRGLVFLAGAYVSHQRCADYWIVGPVFGAVVLAFYLDSADRLRREPKVWAFLAASTLIYALVYRIARSRVPELDGVFDALTLGVLVGTVLLPVAHGVFLEAPWPLVRRTALVVFGVFFVSQLLLRHLELPDWLGRWINIVSIWQGTYLACMFKKEMDRLVGLFRKDA